MGKTAGTQRIQGVLADILRDGRERYNARFLEARRHRSRIEAEHFSELLAGTLAPLVDAVHTADPANALSTFDALYDLSLELLGQDLLGPRARYPAIPEGWDYLLPQMARHLAKEPRKVAGAVTNALYNLAQTPEANPTRWMGVMESASARIADVPTLLKIGQIASWIAGLAHYREESLKELSGLPPDLASVILGLPVSDAPRVGTILKNMEKDPWMTAMEARDYNASAKGPRLKIVRRIGAFKGFGGDFIAPPSVAFEHGQFVVGDGADTWILSADVFGSTLVRHSGAQCKPHRHAAHGANGILEFRQSRKAFPELKQVLSAADDGLTLAVTVPHSHSIYLLAPAN